MTILFLITFENPGFLFKELIDLSDELPSFVDLPRDGMVEAGANLGEGGILSSTGLRCGEGAIIYPCGSKKRTKQINNKKTKIKLLVRTRKWPQMSCPIELEYCQNKICKKENQIASATITN